METIRKHQVSLRGVVSTVVVTTLVLEGWCASELHPCQWLATAVLHMSHAIALHMCSLWFKHGSA